MEGVNAEVETLASIAVEERWAKEAPNRDLTGQGATKEWVRYQISSVSDALDILIILAPSCPDSASIKATCEYA